MDHPKQLQGDQTHIQQGGNCEQDVVKNESAKPLLLDNQSAGDKADVRTFLSSNWTIEVYSPSQQENHKNFKSRTRLSRVVQKAGRSHMFTISLTPQKVFVDDFRPCLT